MKKNKKTVKAPLTHDPGKGRPKEHLAYLNWQEMEALKRLNGNNVERGPKGLPSFADDSASSKGVSRPPSSSTTTRSTTSSTSTSRSGTGGSSSGSRYSGSGTSTAWGGGGGGSTSRTTSTSTQKSSAPTMSGGRTGFGGVNRDTSIRQMAAKRDAMQVTKQNNAFKEDAKKPSMPGTGAISNAMARIQAVRRGPGSVSGMIPGNTDPRAAKQSLYGITNSFNETFGKSYTPSEVAKLTKTVAGEAAGENRFGQAAAANSMYNRISLANQGIGKYMGGTSVNSLLGQYDAAKKRQNDAYRNAVPGSDTFRRGMTALNDAMNPGSEFSRTASPTVKNATHYYNPRDAKPNWANGSFERVGNHMFGNAEISGAKVAVARGLPLPPQGIRVEPASATIPRPTPRPDRIDPYRDPFVAAGKKPEKLDTYRDPFVAAGQPAERATASSKVASATSPFSLPDRPVAPSNSVQKVPSLTMNPSGLPASAASGVIQLFQNPSSIKQLAKDGKWAAANDPKTLNQIQKSLESLKKAGASVTPDGKNVTIPKTAAAQAEKVYKDIAKAYMTFGDSLAPKFDKLTKNTTVNKVTEPTKAQRDAYDMGMSNYLEAQRGMAMSPSLQGDKKFASAVTPTASTTVAGDPRVNISPGSLPAAKAQSLVAGDPRVGIPPGRLPASSPKYDALSDIGEYTTPLPKTATPSTPVGLADLKDYLENGIGTAVGMDSPRAYDMSGQLDIAQNFNKDIPQPTSYAGMSVAQIPNALPPSLINYESGGKFDVGINSEGYAGRAQMGSARLADAAKAGVVPKGTTAQDYAKFTPAQQEAVESWHVSDIKNQIQKNGLDKYVGTKINGVTVTPAGMINVAHLGGFPGLKQYLTTNGAYNPRDKFHTYLSDYMKLGLKDSGAPQKVASADYASLGPRTGASVPIESYGFGPTPDKVIPGLDKAIARNNLGIRVMKAADPTGISALIDAGKKLFTGKTFAESERDALLAYQAANPQSRALMEYQNPQYVLHGRKSLAGPGTPADQIGNLLGYGFPGKPSGSGGIEELVANADTPETEEEVTDYLKPARPYEYYLWDLGVQIPSPGDANYTGYQAYLAEKSAANGQA